MTLMEPVIRPPSEADSFLLQVTLGCSQNKCTFCGAYQDKKFQVKDEAEIKKDLQDYSAVYPDTSRVFLCDGDALVLPQEKLLRIITLLEKSFPRLNRIASYANAQNILNKSSAELQELATHKLKLIYLGLESGNNSVLRSVKKKATAEEAIDAVLKAKDAGIKSHVIVLLGLGQRKNSREHILDSAKAITAMNPRYVSLLSVMLIPGTPIYKENQDGNFLELTPQELLQETKLFLEEVNVRNTLFFCNHASNYLPLEGRLPQDKDRLLRIINASLTGQIRLKPEFLRGL
jgi:radical SAM superfamily enzyme YgiQ (UPF0313 family)